jgi:23S rRNA pseudouridine955/2504/2580 synthase
MTGVDLVTVRPEDGGGRLDRWFRRHYPGLSHGRLEKLLRTGQVRVDGKRAHAGDPIVPGQAIRVPPLPEAPPQPAAPRVRPQDIALLRDAVIYRDDWAVVVNKPAGLAVQGGSNTERHVDALLDGLRFDSAERPRLVHRLDKDTSGILLIARNAAAASFFTRAFREKTTRKIYWAIVVGLPVPPQGRIDLALRKRAGGGRGGERVEADAEEGKTAITYYRVLDNAGDRASWLALLPVTGRTHQLRAHCAALGTPILGDGKYGGNAAHLPGGAAVHRLHLHARSLAIPHPAGGTLSVTAPLPSQMRQMWDFFGFAGDDDDPFAELDLPA